MGGPPRIIATSLRLAGRVSAQRGGMGACPVCSEEVPQALLSAHVESHFSDSPPRRGNVTCALCGLSVAAAELDSHELAHRLQQHEVLEVVDLTGDSDGEAHQDTTPDRRKGTRRTLLWPRIQLHALPGAQRAETSAQAAAGEAEGSSLHALIVKALKSQADSKATCNFRAALCGAPLTHFSTLDDLDQGWGCGWRNTQMLSAHLLGLADDRSRALFAGCGYVPDIASLQAWLEAAWSSGFDPEGAAQLGGSVQGLDTWIGSADAATLLRSFGLRARLVDFKSERQTPQQAPQPLPGVKRPREPEARHHDVECDACGICPILGPRFTSTSVPNYDLCAACEGKPESVSRGPFVRQDEAPGPDICQWDGHRPLVDWMWRYFTTDSAGAAVPWALGTQVLVSPSRAPLFFQHDGHSRTVIGIEKRRRPNAAAEDIFLLILDPGTDRRVLSAALRGDKEAGQGTWHRHLKRGLNTLRKREYSVLVVDPGVAQSREEKEGLKILTSKPPEAYTPQRAAAPVG